MGLRDWVLRQINEDRRPAPPPVRKKPDGSAAAVPDSTAPPPSPSAEPVTTPIAPEAAPVILETVAPPAPPSLPSEPVLSEQSAESPPLAIEPAVERFAEREPAPKSIIIVESPAEPLVVAPASEPAIVQQSEEPPPPPTDLEFIEALPAAPALLEPVSVPPLVAPEAESIAATSAPEPAIVEHSSEPRAAPADLEFFDSPPSAPLAQMPEPPAAPPPRSRAVLPSAHLLARATAARRPPVVTPLLSINEPGEPSAPSAVSTASAAASARPPRALPRVYFLATCLLVYLGIVFCACRLASIGIDARWDFWTYWHPNRFIGDIDNALQQGTAVLHDAQAVGREDQARHPAAPVVDLQAPGPSLLDQPMTVGKELERWRALRPAYSLIYRGWVRHYERLQHEMGGDYELDYPPMRLMVMTLWTWRVRSEFPQITSFPFSTVHVVNPRTHQRQLLSGDIAAPLLTFNLLCDAVSSAAMFFLVWIWANRLPRRRRSGELTQAKKPWEEWGDPLLLAPVVVLGILYLLQPLIGWDMLGLGVSDSLIDARVSSLGWWAFLVVRFLAAVSLARLLPRPFRGPACGLVAATLVWLNPAGILDSFGWPQWDCWLPPFFLVAAVLVSLDCWLLAGMAIGIGCMFKGQLLFVSPVLLLAPLLGGWVRRFVSIVGGLALGAAVVVWPWLIQSGKAEAYAVAVAFAAALACWPMLVLRPHRSTRERRRRRKRVMTALGSPTGSLATEADPTQFPAPSEQPPATRRLLYAAWVLTCATCGGLVLMVLPRQETAAALASCVLAMAVLVVPWVLPRRAIVSWVIVCFTAGVWLAGFSLGGNFSWWNVGFMYGTQKHQVMQLGNNALSNLSSILANRYHWDLHDAVAVMHLPGGLGGDVVIDVQTMLAIVYAGTLLLCAAAAAIHLRRRDPRFLVAITAPWLLFVTVLTQMASRYMILPAMMSAALVAVSVPLSLLQVLLTVLACVMVGNQLLARSPEIAPRAYAMGSATFPDMGWTMVLLAAVMLVAALTPSARRQRHD